MIEQWPADFPHELQEALGKTLLIPEIVTWPEGVPLMTAPAVEAVARPLMKAFHPDLADRAAIAFLFREDMKTRDRQVWGKAMKASTRLRLFSKLDFTIDINWTVWQGLGIHARAALVDHELQHCAVEDGNAVMIAHDLEEFVITVSRWGVWRPSIELMRQVMPQGDLFERDGSPVPDPVGEPAEAEGQPALVP